MTHYWRVKKFLPDRFEQKCRLLVCGRNRACLVEFEDGFKVRTLVTFIRKLK